MNEKKKERKNEREKERVEERKRGTEEERKMERKNNRSKIRERSETLPSELRVLCTTCPTPKLLRLQPARLSLYSITQYEVYKAILSCNIS